MKSKHLLARTLLVALLLLSIGMLAWALAVRLPEINRIREANQKAFRLQDRVEQLEIRRSELQTQVTNKMSQAFSQMFDGIPAVRDWYSAMTKEGAKSGFQVTPSPSEPSSAPSPFQEEALIVPTTVQIQPVGEKPEDVNRHSQLVTMVKGWLTRGKRIEMEGMTVKGDGTRFSAATLSLRLWVEQGTEVTQ